LGSDTVSGDVTGQQVTLTLPANVSGTKYISAVTTMTDNSTNGFGHSSEFAADVEANLVAASNNSILAITGKNIRWLALLIAVLTLVGATGLYLSRRKQLFR
jgi:LPXTG-motif cell wall-anchored protein